MNTLSAPAPVRTTCPYCGVGCGVLATPRPDGSVSIEGDPDHPANRGRLCSKGTALGETLSLETRLLQPEIAGRQVSWEEALDTVAARFQHIIATFGPDAVAFYVSGQLLTEDYYVANKLMKGFIGTANIDTNSRLCMASSVAGHKRAFGEDVVPACYEDLELTDLLVLIGSNAAWCHPVLFQRVLKARENNPALKIVCIDPRRTTTAEASDLHLALRPGTDLLLLNGLLAYLYREGALDREYMDAHLSGHDEALRSACDRAPALADVAAGCGLTETALVTFYQWFATTGKTVTAWSQGINQSARGTDQVNAILNLHLATGRIGKPGMGPLSLTGQPNAMGGREVGGLANQLAAHLDIENPEHQALVEAFWHAPQIARKPGLKAVELFQAIQQGEVKAVWIMATNPAASLPELDAVKSALAACDCVVVSECESATDVMPYAHIRLPALAWGEKNGTVTNSERRISRQRPFLPVPGIARPDWWIIAQVARRMGFVAAFPYESAAAIFAEHAALSGFNNPGQRLFDISALANIEAADYETLAPFQWPCHPAVPEGRPRLFADGGFPTPSGRARLWVSGGEPATVAVDAAYPLLLNTGRIRDQWHTMSRTGKSPRLALHQPEPLAEIHPDDAVRFGVSDGLLLKLSSRRGQVLARARVTANQRPGCVFMPIHWTLQHARQALVNKLVSPVRDACSGQPASKQTPVRIEPYRPAWQGFVLSRQVLDVSGFDYRVSVAGQGFWRYELAGTALPLNWRDWAGTLLGTGADRHWLEFSDPHRGDYRCGVVLDGKLQACLFVSTRQTLPARDWLQGLFDEMPLPETARRSLLHGKPAAGGHDPGRPVCLCFGVGINTLIDAIGARNVKTVEELGTALKAGTGCGACVPELKHLLREHSPKTHRHSWPYQPTTSAIHHE